MAAAATGMNPGDSCMPSSAGALPSLITGVGAGSDDPSGFPLASFVAPAADALPSTMLGGFAEPIAVPLESGAAFTGTPVEPAHKILKGRKGNGVVASSEDDGSRMIFKITTPQGNARCAEILKSLLAQTGLYALGMKKGNICTVTAANISVSSLFQVNGNPAMTSRKVEEKLRELEKMALDRFTAIQLDGKPQDCGSELNRLLDDLHSRKAKFDRAKQEKAKMKEDKSSQRWSAGEVLEPHTPNPNPQVLNLQP
jgi:hypothetical protein